MDASCCALADFALSDDVEGLDAFAGDVAVVDFGVAGCCCPAPPLEAWRALAAGKKTQVLSTAQATLNRVFRIPSNLWTPNVILSPAKIAGFNDPQK